MAELPKYRPLGLAIPTVPTVNFAATGAAKARALDAVSKGLNSMSDYVYKKQVAQTQREALQYAFENPVTEEQIQQAVSEGRDVSEIVGDPDTVFGSITTATAATQLSTELETQLTTKLAQYNALIESGDPRFDVASMRNDLTAMITGHTDVISRVSPKAAMKYSAAANTLAATTYKSGLEQSFKISQAIRKDAANVQLDLAPNIVKNVLLQHAGDNKQTVGSIGAALRVVNDAIIATGDATFIETSSEKLRTIVTEQYQSVLTDWAGQSSATTKRALQGDFGDRYTSLYGALDDTEKAKTREMIRARRDAGINDDKIARDLGVRNAKKEVQRISTAMADLAPDAYQGAEYNRYVDQLQDLAVLFPEAISQTSITAFDKALDPTVDAKPNYVGMYELKRRIFRGEIADFKDLQQHGNNLDVSAKDYYSIAPYLQADIKAEEADVDRIIRRNAKIVDGSNASEKQSKAYYKFERELSDRYEQKIAEWEASGGVGIKPTRLSIAKEIDLEYRRSDEQKDVNNAVSNLIRSFGEEGNLFALNIQLDEDTTEDEIKDALMAAGKQGKDLKALMDVARGRLSILKRAVERRDALR